MIHMNGIMGSPKIRETTAKRAAIIQGVKKARRDSAALLVANHQEAPIKTDSTRRKTREGFHAGRSVPLS
jgi:hypothetical protein